MNQATTVLHPQVAVFNFFKQKFAQGRSATVKEAIASIAANGYTSHNIECAVSKLKKEGVLETISGSGTRHDPCYVAMVEGAQEPVLSRPYRPFVRRTKEQIAHEAFMDEKAKREANATPIQIPRTTNNSIATELARLNLHANQAQPVVKEVLPAGLAIISRSKLPGATSKDKGVALVWRGQELSFDEAREMHKQLNAFFG